MKKLLLLTTLLISSFSFSQNYIGNQEEIDKILQTVSKFSEYVMNSDYESIANSYTTDGKIFPNDLGILEGTETIAKYWKLPEGIKISHHKVTPHEIKIIGNEAYDYGIYEGTTQKADGTSTSWKGKYVIIWKKVENNWKIYLDIWNRIK